MKIIVDSSAQFSYEFLKQNNVGIIDYPIFVDDKEFKATIDMPKEKRDQLREILKDKNHKVTTAGLREKDILNICQKFKDEEIFLMHQGATYSKTTATVINKVASENKQLDIMVFDTGFSVASFSVIVYQAIKAVNKGISREELYTLINERITNTNHLGILFDIFYLKRTGRIGLAKAIMANTMKIIPLLGTTKPYGMLKNIGKVRNTNQANQKFYNTIKKHLEEKNYNKVVAVISVTGPNMEAANQLKNLLESGKWESDIQVNYTNFSSMPHTGPDFYDIGYTVYE